MPESMEKVSKQLHTVMAKLEWTPSYFTIYYE